MATTIRACQKQKHVTKGIPGSPMRCACTCYCYWYCWYWYCCCCCCCAHHSRAPRHYRATRDQRPGGSAHHIQGAFNRYWVHTCTSKHGTALPRSLPSRPSPQLAQPLGGFWRQKTKGKPRGRRARRIYEIDLVSNQGSRCEVKFLFFLLFEGKGERGDGFHSLLCVCRLA